MHSLQGWRASCLEFAALLSFAAFAALWPQVYRAFALSLALNRTLVLPRLKCYCYKNWFMTEQCKIPGDRATSFPFHCTLDQWARPKVLYKGFGLSGANFTFREWTFLSNPRTNGSLMRSRRVLRPFAAPASADASASSSADAAQLLRRGPKGGLQLAQNLSFEQLRSVAPALQGFRLVHVPNVTAAFRGFDSPRLRSQFEGWLNNVATQWCCRLESESKKHNQPIKARMAITMR